MRRRGGEWYLINVTSFSVTSHEAFPCDAKLALGGTESRLQRDTRCIGIVPLAACSLGSLVSAGMTKRRR